MVKNDTFKERMLYDVNTYNDIIGYIEYNNTGQDVVFKTLNVKSHNDKGARCNQASKLSNIERLNTHLGENKYTKQNTQQIKEGSKVVHDAISNTELCILEEFILRYYNVISHNGKQWFVTPERAIEIEIERNKAIQQNKINKKKQETKDNNNKKKGKKGIKV